LDNATRERKLLVGLVLEIKNIDFDINEFLSMRGVLLKYLLAFILPKKYIESQKGFRVDFSFFNIFFANLNP